VVFIKGGRETARPGVKPSPSTSGFRFESAVAGNSPSHPTAHLMQGSVLVVVQTHFFESDRHVSQKKSALNFLPDSHVDQASLARADLDSRRTFALTRIR
jgi:hypothetical protein